MRDHKISITRAVIEVMGNIAKADMLEDPHFSDTEKAILNNFYPGRKFVRGIIMRHNLKSILLHGEGADAEAVLLRPEVIASLADLASVIAEYPPQNVFNMDETGLFYRCLPRRTYLLSHENTKEARGSKALKDKYRVSVYMFTNAPMSLGSKSLSPILENRCILVVSVTVDNM